MRPLLRYLAIVSLSLPSQVSLAAQADGFRDLAWGTELATVKNSMIFLSKIPSYGGVELYKRKDDKLRIGKAQLTEIGYCFWNGQLSDVLITFSGFANFEGVRAAMSEEFGNDYRPNRLLDEYHWSGKGSKIQLSFDKVSGRGVLSVMSVAMADKQQQYFKAKVNERVQVELLRGEPSVQNRR
jgi:hypothetical protein